MTQVTTQNSSTLLLREASAEASAQPSRLADHATLIKPRITMLVVITAFIGFAMALPGEPWPPLALIATLIGTGLSCMGASVFNQIYERDTDALMDRTSNRPLPAGRVGVGEAVALGAVYSLLGVGLLWLLANPLAAAVSAATILIYAAVYTPLKRVTTLAVWIGAVPGALPPVIGYAAATGEVGTVGWLLFAIMFVWQVPHFLAIAWLYRSDYARAGIKMLPVVQPDGHSTFRQILAGCLTLLPLGLLPTLLGISGLGYFVVALACGLFFLAYAAKLVLDPTRQRARRLFFASLVYLPVVLGAMPLNQVGA